MGMTLEQQKKYKDWRAYTELMRKSDELLKDTGSVSYGGAEQVLNDLKKVQSAYGDVLTTGRLDTAISEWEGIVQDKRERYERTADIRSAYDNQIASIDANLKRNEDMIAGQREGAIKQAYAGYDRSKSTYGQNAEKLARMGLGNSGYSDYLTGVAYGNMVGGIENANTSANEALEKAYYNADQQKLQAAAERDTAIANAEKAYGEKEASLIAAINSGEIDLETAIGMAKAYGLTSGTIANLEKVAKAYEDKVKKKEIDTAKTEFDNYISNNGNTDEYGNKTFYSADEIRQMAKSAGYSDEEIDKYVQDNDKMALDYYSSLVSSGDTDEDIDSLNVSDTVKAGLKAKRDEKHAEDVVAKVKAQIESEVESGNVSLGNLAEVDNLYANGKISQELYESTYFDKALSFASGIENISEYEEVIEQIDGYVNQGKMTKENAEKVKAYIATSFAKVVPGSVAYKEDGALIVDGVKYPIANIVAPNVVKDEAIKDIIDRSIGENEGYVVIDGKVYAKSRYGVSGYEYYKVRNKEVRNAIVDNIDANLNTTTKPNFQYKE